MKTLITNSNASGIPESMGRKQLLLHNVSPVLLKFGWELDTTWSGPTEGLPLEPGEYRTFADQRLDLSGRLVILSDNLGASITGDVTNGSTTVDNIANGTSSLLAGMAISGAGIPDDTFIATVVSATEITLSRPATATNASTALSLAAPVVYTQRG